MRWLKTIFNELIGLFVDDGSFAVSILVWLALMWALVAIVHSPPAWNGLIAFAGLASILIESVLRRSRR